MIYYDTILALHHSNKNFAVIKKVIKDKSNTKLGLLRVVLASIRALHSRVPGSTPGGTGLDLSSS